MPRLQGPSVLGGDYQVNLEENVNIKFLRAGAIDAALSPPHAPPAQPLSQQGRARFPNRTARRGGRKARSRRRLRAAKGALPRPTAHSCRRPDRRRRQRPLREVLPWRTCPCRQSTASSKRVKHESACARAHTPRHTDRHTCAHTCTRTHARTRT